MLDGALLLLERGLELVQVLALGSRELRLDARLEAGLGLGHELGPDVVPVGVVGGRDGHGRVREVADLCEGDRRRVRGKRLPPTWLGGLRVATQLICDSTCCLTIGRIVS